MFLWQIITDLLFFAGTNSAVKFHSTKGATVYYYLFDYRGSNSFISLFMNSTADIGECLEFVEYVKHLQWAIREHYIFVSFQNTTEHVHTSTCTHII